MHSKTYREIASFLLCFFCVPMIYAGGPLRDLSIPLPKDLEAFRKIRILVIRDKPEVKVSCEASFEVFDDQGRSVLKGASLPGATVKPVGEGIQWWTQVIPTRFLLLKSVGNGIRVSNTGLFGDTVLFYRNTIGRLDIINELNLDDYLKGVVPFEGNPKWTIETLKAQAVVSRTFALTRMIERHAQEYDVMSGVFSQVYAGKKIENARANDAIEATKGQVLTYNNKLFPAYFHSTCGGATTAADLVWPVKPHPALGGVECRFCGKSPHFRWEARVTPEEIKEKLAKHNMPVNEVLDVKTGKIDRTGRAHTFIIQSTRWEKTVDADAFRVWLDPMRLKSNLITKIRRAEDGAFVFKGKGWGHGVGLCQYGAKYLGELGYSYHEILGYYFPGSQIVELKEIQE